MIFFFFFNFEVLISKNISAYQKKKPVDGSFASINQQFLEWKRQRYGITSPRNISIKTKKATDILMANKLKFTILILLYFGADLIGNAAIMLVLNSIDKNPIKDYKTVIVKLTANLPCRLLRSALDLCVYYITMCAIKRRDYSLDIMDAKNLLSSFTFTSFFKIFLLSEILSFAITAAQALLAIDPTLCVIYFIIGFFFNLLFSMAPLLIIEDQSISTITSLIWSASTTLNSQYKGSILLCTAINFLASPIIIVTPFLLVLLILTFYEAFGYTSPTEVHFTTND